MNQRQQQVGSLLKRVISDVVARRLSDPRLEGMLSITHVDVSPDLRQAQVYVSVYPDKHAKTSVFALNHATRHVHALVSKQVALRTVPHLEFRLDDALKRQAQVFAAIDRGIQREQAHAADDAADIEPEQEPRT